MSVKGPGTRRLAVGGLTVSCLSLLVKTTDRVGWARDGRRRCIEWYNHLTGARTTPTDQQSRGFNGSVRFSRDINRYFL